MKIEEKIRTKLEAFFSPCVFELENESRQHNVPDDSETHFRAVIVSEKFKGLSRVERQRAVHQVIKEELAGGVHAFSQRALTPAEWEKTQHNISASPQCLGGGKEE